MRFFTIAFAAALCLGSLVHAAPGSIKRGGSTSGPDASVVDQSYTQDVRTAGQQPQTPGGGSCGGAGQCPTGPTSPTDCVGIIQSLLRELYPTLDFAGHELDTIVADILRILGADDLSYAFLHGRIGLLNDLLARLGCTIEQLILAIERVVTGIL